MNTLKNKVQLIGNLGSDPEIINLESGKTLAKFTMATNQNFKNSEGEKQMDTRGLLKKKRKDKGDEGKKRAPDNSNSKNEREKEGGKKKGVVNPKRGKIKKKR